MQNKLAMYQNRKRKTTSQLKKRDKIYLLTKNLKIKKPRIRKMNYVKVGPFLIKKAKRPVNYKLDLSKNARVFSIFYILLLKSADPSISIQKIFYYKAQKDNRYKIEQILEQQDQKYLVK